MNIIEELKKYKTWVPPGHYYSPIPDINEVERRKEQIFSKENQLHGIQLDEAGQIDFLKSVQEAYNSIPFLDEASESFRYNFVNNMFSYGDATSLYLMMHHYKPKQIIEIGSGYSSAVMLDTAERFDFLNTSITFIEPYADRLKNLLRPTDNINLIELPIQDVSLDIFDSLEAGDILFIDSTHVSKVGSDVNHIFFNIIPKVKKGVLIHIHDIGVNFEYPYRWVKEGRAWNEAYLLRAFLMFNSAFKIELYNSVIVRSQKAFFQNNMPIYLKNSGGSLWMKRISD